MTLHSDCDGSTPAWNQSARSLARMRCASPACSPDDSRLHGVAIQEAEVDSAMAAIVRGEAMVREQEQIDAEAPVIVLDANSFVGQQLLRRLAGRNVYPVDGNRLGAGAVNKEAWPAHLTGKPALLLNVARTRTPAAYLDLLWNSVVVLNEAYPQPPRSVLDQFAARHAGSTTWRARPGPLIRISHGPTRTRCLAARRGSTMIRSSSSANWCDRSLSGNKKLTDPGVRAIHQTGASPTYGRQDATQAADTKPPHSIGTAARYRAQNNGKARFPPGCRPG